MNPAPPNAYYTTRMFMLLVFKVLKDVNHQLLLVFKVLKDGNHQQYDWWLPIPRQFSQRFALTALDKTAPTGSRMSPRQGHIVGTARCMSQAFGNLPSMLAAACF